MEWEEKSSESESTSIAKRRRLTERSAASSAARLLLVSIIGEQRCCPLGAGARAIGEATSMVLLLQTLNKTARRGQQKQQQSCCCGTVGELCCWSSRFDFEARSPFGVSRFGGVDFLGFPGWCVFGFFGTLVVLFLRTFYVGLEGVLGSHFLAYAKLMTLA